MIPRWALRIGAVTTVLIPQLLGGATSEVREPNDRWSDRLEALEPERPLAYLELAEEIVDAEADEELLALAAHLYALAGVLDTPRLGRSACLGLADLSRQEHVKRRLRALARLLADDEVVPAEETLTSSERPSAVALAAVSQAFSLYRRGQGSRALASLRRPGAMELLQSQDQLLIGGVNRFLEDCRLYRAGDQRPRLSPDEISAMLRHEQALLAGEDRSWSSDLLVGAGMPLVEIDPLRLAETLDVDPTRPRYRSGRWVK